MVQYKRWDIASQKCFVFRKKELPAWATIKAAIRTTISGTGGTAVLPTAAITTSPPMASVTCGILSITTCCTGILPLPLGALGILFAVLVYRKGKKLNSACVMGITTSCLGIAVGLMMTIYSFAMLPALLKNEAFRSQFDTLTQQMYGMDFEEFMEEFYGYTISE